MPPLTTTNNTLHGRAQSRSRPRVDIRYCTHCLCYSIHQPQTEENAPTDHGAVLHYYLARSPRPPIQPDRAGLYWPPCFLFKQWWLRQDWHRFTEHSQRSSSVKILFSSSPNDDWSLEDTGGDPRESMRSMLESSWDGGVMGIVPSGPGKGAEAASEFFADAMRQNKNSSMVNLRLPSYNITEAHKIYDNMAACDLCSFLSDNLRERKLIWF